MNLETARSHWQNIDAEHAARWTKDNIQFRWVHPALLALRRTLLFECLAWTVFFLVYCTLLSGDRSSVFWTVSFGGGLLLLIAHGILGYRLASGVVGDRPIIEALTSQLSRLHAYSIGSMILRGLTLTLLATFLLAWIPDLGSPTGTWAVATAGIWVAAALFIQYRLWRGRFRELNNTLVELTA